MTNFHEALESFEQLEQRLNLPEWAVGGVYVWKLARLSIFRDYLKTLGLQTESQPESKRLQRTKLQMIKDFPKPFLSANPFIHGSNDAERVVIPHSRKKYINDRYVDPLTQPAWQHQNASTTLLLERAGSPNEPDPSKGELSLEVIQRLAWIRRQAALVRLTDDDRRTIRDIEGYLGLHRLSTGLDLSAQLKKHARAFLGQKSIFDKLIKLKRPSYLYCVVSYGLEALIDAAQANGVRTIEFQHGTLGRGHLAYDYKGWQSVPYFPDTMLGFGPAWFHDTNFPDQTKRVMIGNPYLEQQVQSAIDRSKKQPRTLLVISQGAISEAISREISQFAALRPDWQVIYRPHPGENPQDIENRLRDLRTSGARAGRSIQIDAQTPFADQAAAAEAAVGAYSTAVIEAVLAGCRIALLDLGRSTNAFQYLADQGKARIVADGKELAEVIDKLPQGDARDYYAEPVHDVPELIERRR